MSSYPRLSFLLRNARQNRFSAVSVRSLPFPLGRDPSSLPLALTEKLDPNMCLIDKRPISLRFRVSSLIELSELDKAAQVSRLAVWRRRYQGWDTKVMMCNEITGAMCEPKRLLTKGLVDSGRIYEALTFVKTRNLWDSMIYSFLIRGFLDQGNHDKANQLFDELNNKTMPDCTFGYNRMGTMPGHADGAVVDATFVDYWFKQGEDERAMEIYRSLISRKREQIVCVATWNTLLEILLENGKQTEAWHLFNAMVTNSKTFDRETFGTMVNSCFKMGHFKEALDTFKRPELTRSSRCYANIIAKLCDRGMMSEAQGLFEEMCSDNYLCPDVPTFRSMISGYAKAGRVDEAIKMLKYMVDATLLKFAVQEAH